MRIGLVQLAPECARWPVDGGHVLAEQPIPVDRLTLRRSLPVGCVRVAFGGLVHVVAAAAEQVFERHLQRIRPGPPQPGANHAKAHLPAKRARSHRRPRTAALAALAALGGFERTRPPGPISADGDGHACRGICRNLRRNFIVFGPHYGYKPLITSTFGAKGEDIRIGRDCQGRVLGGKLRSLSVVVAVVAVGTACASPAGASELIEFNKEAALAANGPIPPVPAKPLEEAGEVCGSESAVFGSELLTGTPPSAIKVKNEWGDIVPGKDMMVSGTVTHVEFSGGDLSIDHPFSTDFTFDVALDEPYWPLARELGSGAP